MILLKRISIYIMSAFYIWVGINHFLDPGWFMHIMPPYLPYHLELVYISGAFEILLGSFLIFSDTRKIAGTGLILLLIAVFPANIYLAFNNIPQQMLGISSFAVSWVRLPIQPVLIAIAYWHSKLEI